MQYSHLFLIGTFLLIFFSCKKGNFLEETVTTNLNEQTVFSDSAFSMSFLNDIYTSVGFSFNPTRFNNGGLDAASSEADVPRVGVASTSEGFATGSLTPSTVTGDAWSTCYNKIRAVNQFLKHVDSIPFPESLKRRTTGEARFLRAWYYSQLLKHYGGIPLVGDTLYKDNEEILAKRNTYEECVDYIVSECEKAAELLPTRQMGLDYGRAGAGACMALKARVLLYAASPLFNGDNAFNQGVSPALRDVVGYTSNDPNRWKLAADAARKVIGLGAYSLHRETSENAGVEDDAFQDVFIQRVNDEIIFAQMRSGNRDFESAWMPPSRGGNGEGAYPYQELVDAFLMKDGKSIFESGSEYNPERPYDNRDPRLANTIMHDSSLIVLYRDAIQPIMGIPLNLYVGAGQDAVYNRTTTGYYVNKMLKPDIAGNCIHGVERPLPLIRFAEILLDFAEAENEFQGPTAEVFEALKEIRSRAGIEPGGDAMYGLDPAMDKVGMREVIRNERRIELAFEEHWFWDVRRWMIADATEDGQMHGMESHRTVDSPIQVERFVVRKRNFRKAMYLFPLPESEVAKSSLLTQNPYWSTTAP